MPCIHRFAYRAEDGRYHCHDCKAPLIVDEFDPESADYREAVTKLVRTARRFAKVTRERRADLYAPAFRDLEVAAGRLDRWLAEPVLPPPRSEP